MISFPVIYHQYHLKLSVTNSLDAYVLPIEPNPDWSQFYVGQQEILTYIKKTSDKYNLCKHIQLNTTIKETLWDEGSAQWEVQLEQGGELKHDKADFLINASGVLKQARSKTWESQPLRTLQQVEMARH